jgi:hypothetical protein
MTLTTLRWNVETADCQHEGIAEELLGIIEELVATFDGQDDALLREKADYLQTTDGEGWAVGNLVHKVVALRGGNR